jgi:hypothetical protein
VGMRLWDRWGPLAGVVSVVCSVVGVLLVLGQPQTTDSDTKIVSYFGKHSHQVQSIVGFFVVVAGILFLLVFLAALRERLLAAEGQPGRLTALAFGAGIAAAPLWGVSMVAANAAGFTSNDTSKFQLDPNTFRLLGDTAYVSWVAAVIISALVVWATSAVALRTGLLPRWFARLGILVGVIQLFAIFFFPLLVWWAWLIITSVLLVWRRSTASAPLSQPMA